MYNDNKVSKLSKVSKVRGYANVVYDGFWEDRFQEFEILCFVLKNNLMDKWLEQF